MMHHGAVRIPLAVAVMVGLMAYACGRDEGLGENAELRDEAHGGAGGEHSLGNGGRLMEGGRGGAAGEAGGDAGTGGADVCRPTSLPENLVEPVHGLSLKQVSVLQAVSIPIMEQMIEVEARRAQIIEGRPGLLRVSVKPAANWRAREVRCRLTLRQGPAGVPFRTVHEQTLLVAQASSHGEPASTFNFELPAEAFDVSTSYSVELLETESCTEHDGDVEDARFPVDDGIALGVVEGHTLRVRIVPIEMHVDDEVFLPDISSEQLELLRREVVKLFPVRDVEITVRDAALSSTAPDMVGVLEEVAALRDEENTDPGLSYYGLVRFSADIVSYCSPSCVLGAAVNGEVPVGGAAVGIGYKSSKVAATFAHELGHVLGRPHTPCAVAGDPQFPYAGGGIGNWGYDLFEKALVDPADHRDFMGYCSPTWVSDHTYEHLRDFIEGLPSARVQAARRKRGLGTSIIRCGEQG